MAKSEPEDEDLAKAIAMSLASQATSSHVPNQVEGEGLTSSERPHSSSEAKTGIFALDRKAMERERLARLVTRKRDRSISPPPFRDARKAPKIEQTTVDLPSGARLNMFSTIVQQDQGSRKSNAANVATANLKVENTDIKIKTEPIDDTSVGRSSLRPGEVIFPAGVVKKTWAFGHERKGNDVKLEEVLEPSTLRTAVLSAFQWDIDWLLSKLKIPPNGGSTKCVFVMQAEEDALRQQMTVETENMRSFLRLCFPSMDGQIHCMHSKLMLLFHPNKLRIAIPTANLLNFDWGETGLMENTVFMIDLPRLPDRGKTELKHLPIFGEELVHFLEKQGLDQDIRDGVLNFDFAATEGMAFVHTVGGVHYRSDAERTGLPGLGRAVRALKLQTNELEVDFAASSIGSLNDEYLRNVHCAAKGEDLISRATESIQQAKTDFFKPKAKDDPHATSARDIREQMRIYFPTRDTVEASTAGAAGTICLSRKWFENAGFPRSCFRDYRSTRPGLLSHNKILYARGKQVEKKTAKDVAWVYVGSANMSESAWGKLVYDKKNKQWKVNCRNWECGVLLPVSSERLALKGEARSKREVVEAEGSETESEDGGQDAFPCVTGGLGKIIGMEVFDGLVDLPFNLPGQAYGDREPWYFQERPQSR